ncbi:MAG: MBL fold metallo-hydrolase [Longimicrobiales bacterium]|nr:MBL fold metallo-hydrolase [Longimicrobiales bacterium]
MRIDTFEGGPFAQNTSLLTCTATGTTVVVDPGHGTREVLRTLDPSGPPPEAVLLTHAHIDHVDGIPLLVERWPGLTIRMHPGAREFYEAAGEQASWFGLPPFELPPAVHDLEPGITLRYGREIELSVRYAPGHAPGHVIFMHEASHRVLVGDVVFHRSIGRTDLPGGDHEQLLESIRREILSLPDDVELHPGHGPVTTVGVERRSNPFLQGLAPEAGR